MNGSTLQRPPTTGGTDFVRIGLAGPSSRADLAVPAGVPLARLLPSLLRHAGEDPGADGGVRHGGWSVRRGDGTRLDAAVPLAAQGVQEGDLLFLRHGDEDTAPPLYDDVTEVIGQHAVLTGWPAAATRRTAAALAAVGVLVGCGALAGAIGRTPGWLGLAVALCTLAVGTLLARAFGDVAAGTVAALLAAPPAMLGAVRLLGTEAGTVDGFTGGHLLLACAVLAAVGALGPVLVGGGDGAFAALVVVGPLAASGALLSAGWDVRPAEAASVAAPLALALSTLWPALALRLARLPAPRVAGSPEDLEALPSQLEYEALRAGVARARRLLGGLSVGGHVVAGAGTLVLFASPGPWPWALGAVLVVLTLLRARLFREAGQVAVPLATALLAVVGAAGFTLTDRVGEALPLLGVALPAALLLALVSGGVALSAGRVSLNPRLARAFDVFETVALLAVVPLVLAVWEVYSALLELRA
ncbi:type VII secretion integral membrane protein EccD [Streptomyces mayteni]